MQLYARRYCQTDIGSGTDEAILAWPVPKNSVLNYLRGEAHVVVSTAVPVGSARIYAIEGWTMPLSDAQTDLDNMEDMWDALVPKDDDLVDIDTAFAADTDPVKEVGEVNVSQLFNQERVAGLQRVFQKEGFLTFANAPLGFVPGTPPANTFIPSEVVQLGIKGKFRFQTDGALIFGAAAPAMDFTADNNIITSDRLDGMYMLRFMSDFMDKAQIDLTDFHQAGAEAPYETIMLLLLNFLERVNVNDGSFAMAASPFTVSGKAIMGIQVEGSMSHTTVGPDSQAN